MSGSNIRAWAKTWQRAGDELGKIRRRELAALTDEQARAIVADLFSIPVPADLPPRPQTGLVEQQRLFARLRRPA